MSTTTNNPIRPETSSFNPFNIIGGLLSDTIEAAKYIGSEIVAIPQAIEDGYNNGAMIDTENSTALKEAAIAPIVAKHTDAQEVAEVTEESKEIAALKAQIAELRAAQATPTSEHPFATN